ncbi:hypothetical protein [Alterisphingorhabdus coralli]|uniref:Uncharacterized protein n=1 Tax=Alterisphingorhabdus coralli TaxID=3071408 RepID=A0AA97I0T1_9SPHN|nr:hypothetical protein [Parasphingorhabdus sp. SCSIO 66989]WOE74658.1 hypothetical protein RB602_12500 [Parasphingorhabdus sp. SCSIO 66989]
MSSLNSNISANARQISLADAADIIGRRFHHEDWKSDDPFALENGIDQAPDREAWTRARHVQDELTSYVTGGWVTAYALADDGVSFTKLPMEWLTNPSFALNIRTGCFMVHIDQWEQIWFDRPELLNALPKAGQPRQKHTFEWDKIIHEGWMFALRQETVPIKAEIVRHLGSWCPENKQAVPDGSLLAKVAKTIVDFLTENKTGWENLKMKRLEAKANE